MKGIKSLLSICILLSFITNSYSQFGLRGGLNLSTISISGLGSEDFEDAIKTKTGFHFGFTYQIPLSPMVSIEPGLILTNKGFLVEYSEGDFKVSNKSSSYYLELPVLLKVKFALAGANLFIQGGPYMAIGIGGTLHSHNEDMGDIFDEVHDINWGSGDKDNQELIDIGLSVGAGVEFNAFQIALNYEFGLTNIIPTAPGDEKATNRVLGISLGYNFGSNEDVAETR